jgi:DNA polymerase IV
MDPAGDRFDLLHWHRLQQAAKIASDMQKPDGLTIIGEGDITARIWPLPVRKIPGVGPVTEERLRSIGVETIGQLTAMQLDTLLWLFS